MKIRWKTCSRRRSPVLGFSPTDANIYTPEGRERWWRADASECKAEEGEISTPGFSLDESLFLFSLSFACSFPSHSLQLVHQNVIWWKKNPEQALPPLHQTLLIERSSDMDPEGIFFLILNPDSPTQRDQHLITWGDTFQGWNCWGCFPKYDPKEEELVMEDYAPKTILKMNM